jgi:hypothetical protein
MQKVLNSTPSDNEQEAVVSSEPIIINLNRQATSSTVFNIKLTNVSSVPTNDKNAATYNLGGRIVFINKSINYYVSEKTPLLPLNNYQLSMSLKNRLGFNQEEFVLNFKTENQADSSLPVDQQNKALENIDALQDGRVAGLEIVNSLPYNSDSFYIIHNVLSNNTVEIVVYLKGDQAKSKQAALAWIKSKGADPNKLNIKYEENKYF